MYEKINKLIKDNSRTILYVSLIVISLFIIGGVFYVVSLVDNLPSLDQFDSLKVSESTKIYDRTGDTLLYEVFGEEKRTVIPFDKIPEYVKQAAIAAEDEGFYTQPAFDWRGILRALIVNIKQGEIVQGGSTITQQLVKNAFLTPERTIARKIKELVLAIELESRHSKDQILSAYLNQIPYGSNAYGIESASQTYFSKPTEELTIAEAATLASLPRAPSYYSPWGENRKELIERKDFVLDKMYELGYITKPELEKSKSQKLNFTPPSIGNIKAPHFSLAVKNYLVNKYGEERVRSGGLIVKTTLDWEIQQIAEKVVEEGAQRNENLYNGRNASLVAQNPKTGQVLTMVGSRDYFNEEIDGQFNVATQGLRQPGSALKPFAYLTAFQKGYRPRSVIFDLETEFVSQNPDCPPLVTDKSEENEDCFNPENFDNRFRGPVTMQEGLSQSINIPSVKALYLAGFDNTLETLHKAGITTLNERWRYGLSLVLGGGEVKLIDLINAYSTLADEGIKHNQTLVLEVKDSKGEVLESYSDESERVIDQNSVRQINQVLSDVELRAGLFQSSLGLTVFEGREVALKTGTTDDYRDAWAMGYTPSLAVGVWAGNSDNTPMSQRGSSLLAAVPMWSNFFDKVFDEKEYPKEVFSRPDPQPPISKPMVNGEYNVAPVIDDKAYPQVHSILYWINKNNPLGDIPVNPQSDSQFYNWENTVIEWAKQNIRNFENYNKELPKNIDNSDLSTNQNNKSENITIDNISPENGSFISGSFNFEANIESENKISLIRLYLNNNLIDMTNLSSSRVNYDREIKRNIKEQNIVELRITDSQGNEKSKSVIIYKN